MSRIGRTDYRRGFTLVELMVAMALVGLLTAVIYGLFVQTSDSMADVEHHTAALDQARYGIQQVRTGLWAAGSQATANSDADPWVLSADRGASEQPQVLGLLQDEDWQDESLDDVGFGGPTDRNSGSAFSSFVVLGAFDVPANLFVSFPEGLDTGDPEFVVEGTERGLYRTLGYDPFDTGVVNEVDVPDPQGLENRAEQRLLRVQDSEGYSQIQPIESATHDASGDTDTLTLELPELYFRTGDEPAGFDASTPDDVSFDAAMVDAYWYYVKPARDDDRNLQLIRQRLDATDLLDDLDNGGVDRGDLEDIRVDPPMILAERVADFRVWFDCDDGTNWDWQQTWDVESDDCVDQGNPEDAHVAHVRLSTRSASENPNRPHFDLEGVDPGFESEDGQMRTFELFSEAEGSAAVVTTQTSVELTNFAMHR